MRGLGVSMGLATMLALHAAHADDAHVLEVRPGEVDVTLVPTAKIDQGVAFHGSRLLGYVLAIHNASMTVRLPIDAQAHVGDGVDVRKENGGGVDVAPRRPSRILSVVAELGTYAGFPLGSNNGGGVQTVSSAAIIYRSSQPIAVHATLAHAALAFGSPSNLAAIDTSLGASFDSDYFEAGLATGLMTVNDGSYDTATAAFTLEPFVRVGAVDGIMLFARMQAGLIQNAFRFAGVSGELAYPVAARLWGFFRGAGGSDGFGRLDTGVRVLVRGNGDHGSVFLRFAIGVSVTWFHPITEDFFGPGTSVGIEYRP